MVVNPDSGPKITGDYLSQLRVDLRSIIAETVCRGMFQEEFQKICAEIFREYTK